MKPISVKSLPARAVAFFRHHISTILQTLLVALQKMKKRYIAHFFQVYLEAEIVIYRLQNPKLATLHAK